ncbi:protein fem-1 homolog C-like isoform X2 [Diadema antillarum]|uniref:protein fem-1 homolog C-like isoform X2 n=1 Tax=Diadema antillarum TaxID=105358 RepID=UPI003A88D368
MESRAGSSDDTGEQSTPSLAQALVEGELAGLESIQNYVANHTNEGVIDTTASDGRTALIIACEKGQKDIVKYLLESGANPNVPSPKSGDTPLHVICRKHADWRQDIAEDTRIKIAQMLLQHGATFRENGRGLNPVHVAALSRFTSVVEFLMSQCNGSGMPEVDEVTSLEMLGFSLYMDKWHNHAYDMLCKVISKRCHIPEIGADPELEAIFQCTEKYSLADVQAMKGDKHSMKVQWFLTGDRIVPEGAKGKYLFRPMAYFSCKCMKHDRPTLGYNIFKYILLRESKSNAVLGTVMEGISPLFGVSLDKIDPSIVASGCEVVTEYQNVIQHVSQSCLIEQGPHLLENFGELIFDFAFYFSEPELLESMIKTAGKVITKVRTAFSPSDLDKYTAGSLTFHVMGKLAEAYVDNMYSGMTRQSLNRVKRVLCKLLWYDDVTYVDDKNNTMLHLLAYSTSLAHDSSFIVDLARILIRHGCPVDKINDEDGTPVNILMEDDGFCSDDEDSKELADMLGRTSSITTLEEMAARAVLQNKIPYHEVLPEKICEMIDGETMDPDPSVLKTPEKSESESD